MGKAIELTASDGHKFNSYVAEPAGKPRGAVVVMQEAFGVNKHIRAVTDGYAADGYLAIAPGSYERVQRGFETGYSEAEIQIAIGIMKQVSWDDAIKDMKAAIDHVKHAGKVGIVGFCWGGSAAWLAATRIPGLACAVAYYGGSIPDFLDEKPMCPVMFHFGEQDTRPSLEQGKKIVAAHPKEKAYFYPAGHGFNCDHRGSFNPESSKLARTRTLAFFQEHIG